MQVGNALISGAGEANGASANSRRPEQDLESRFLTLLISQIKNQDPLNPLDNAEFTSQLAQLNMVGGIERLNNSMEGLAKGIRAAETLQAANLIGRNVLVPGDALDHAGHGGRFGIELSQPVDALTIRIHDAAGNVVERIDLGPQPAGVHGLEWDGRGANGEPMTEGRYRIEALAASEGGQAKVTVLGARPVTAVTMQSDGIRIVLPGEAPISLDQVRQII